jgi:hypothetical protein
MSLNALPASQLFTKSATSAAVGTVFTYFSGNYAGVSSPVYNEIIGKTGALVGGTIDIPLNILDIPTAVVGQACIIEAWLNNTAAGAGGGAGAGVKYVGVIVTAGGPPINSAILRINALDENGALVAGFTGQLGFRVLIPRSLA